MRSKLSRRFEGFQREIEIAHSTNYYTWFRRFETSQETKVTVRGKEVLMFGSNSYLSLTTDERVKEASIRAIEKYGTSCSGSRFLNGTTDLHEELEHKLAKFLGKESVLVFSTGFQVNLGVIPSITTAKDVILLDRYNHASIFEGARLSDARKVVFRHNDMSSLEKKLQRLGDADMRLIIVDGIFSMEGDIAKLPEIVDLAKKYDAVVMTDCAHAIGVLGDHGKGTPDHFGLTDEVELIGGTFSKSLASLGGFIAGSKETINHLKHHARSLIFSASMTPASTAATLKALEIMETDNSLQKKLWDNAHYAMNSLKKAGFDLGAAETPIIPVYVRDWVKAHILATELFNKGVFVNLVVAPAVPPEMSMIRFSVMASHSKEEIDFAINQLVEVNNIISEIDPSFLHNLLEEQGVNQLNQQL